LKVNAEKKEIHCEGVLDISVNKKRLGIDISLFATCVEQEETCTSQVLAEELCQLYQKPILLRYYVLLNMCATQIVPQLLF